MKIELSKADLIKHYIGIRATCEGKSGRVMCVDTDENNVSFVYGVLEDKIHLFREPDQVDLNLRSFADFLKSGKDLESLIDSMIFNTQRLFYMNFKRVGESTTMVEVMMKHHDEEYMRIKIRANWSISIEFKDDPYGPHTPDNYPELVLILCQLGYDVTGKYKNGKH